MKTVITVLFCLFVKLSFGQFSFSNRINPNDTHFFIMVVDQKDTKNSYFIYSDKNTSPLKLTILNEVQILGKNFIKVSSTNGELYFLNFSSDYSSLSVYNSELKPNGDYKNDLFEVAGKFKNSGNTDMSSFVGLLKQFK